MAGRRPKPAKLKLLANNPGKRPIPPEPAPAPGRPVRPRWLVGEARKEWDRLCDVLSAERRLSASDAPVLEKIAVAHALWLRWRALADAADLVVTGADGSTRANPVLQQERLAADHCRRLYIEIGLTPAARSRVRVAPTAPPDSPSDRMRAFLDRQRRSHDPA